MQVLYNYQQIFSSNQVRNFLSEKIFEFSIFYSKVYDLYKICIYRTPDLYIFGQNLLSLFESLPTKSKFILCPDFNIDYTSVCATQESRQFIFESFGIFMYINSPTTITKTSSSTIDH